MGIDDRSGKADASPFGPRRSLATEKQKRLQAEALKTRFSRYLEAPRGTIAPLRRKSLVPIALVLAFVAILWVLFIASRILSNPVSETFPSTGETRWFIPVLTHGSGTVAPLTITGPLEAGQNGVVQLDSWEAHTLIAAIAIRGGETATLHIPFGRYRITYAPNAKWQGQFRLLGDAREGLEPLEFSRRENQIVGIRIDLNGRINGNLKTRSVSYF